MREAVVHIEQVPTATPSDAARAALRSHGVQLRLTDDRVAQMWLRAADPADARTRATAAWRDAFGAEPVVAAVTFVSRGTDEDALGVIAAFGLDGHIERTEEGGEEVVVVTIPAEQRRRAPESRLHTALEAALNCEVRLRFS